MFNRSDEYKSLQSLFKLMSMESVRPPNHLILSCPLLLLPSIFPNIRVFSNESALHIRWPKYWGFSFSISPSSKHSGLISFRLTGLISLLFKALLRVLQFAKKKKKKINNYYRCTVKKFSPLSISLSLSTHTHIYSYIVC